ncbi:glycosyltransferase family 4 protein [Acinetobacter baumannii]|uniref:glycosyltransferase family 4 protein n=1 Tax=Acinetobacter baumannii TaxID=470 RepID=UPI0029586E10|nr:glycosyltransferase family 4 protein [Acinetobacter baumannii]WNX59879.1 glycosyltransferase family 4 protein [Acinetobacter baumannii]
MKKICFLIGDINHSGGTERVTTLIANNLIEKYKVHILSLSGGDNPFFEQNKAIINNRLFPEKVSMKTNFFKTVYKIRKYINDNKIDTLIVVDSISCVFSVPACVGLNIKHICWEHFNLKVNLGSSFRTLGRWMAAKWCDKIVTLTNRDKDFWIKNFKLEKEKKVIAIANPSPYQLQNNQPSLDSKTILCVGRLTYQKGFDLLIPAWAEIEKALVGWKIVIVGTGEDEDDLKQMAKNYNVECSIDFVGQQKNMSQFYNKASFFCMSSRFEGLPMVLLEARSYNLPIVSFDCDTGPAEVIEDGKDGFLAQADNLHDFSQKILKMAKMDENTFLNFVESSKSTSNRFEIQNIINLWIELVSQ